MGLSEETGQRIAAALERIADALVSVDPILGEETSIASLAERMANDVNQLAYPEEES